MIVVNHMKFNYPKMIILNYIYLILLEGIFKLFVMKTVDIGMMYIIIFSLPIAIILTFIMSLFKNRQVNRVISILLWTIIFFVFAAETVYYSFYKTICGLSALMYGGQVMEFWQAILVHIKANGLIIIAFFIPLILLIISSCFKQISHEKYNFKDTFILLITTIFFVVSSLELQFKDNDLKKLIYNTNDIIESTNYVGLISSISMDALKVLTDFEESITLTNKLPFTKEEKTEYNLTNINFDELIAKTNDETLKNMHQYFKTEVPSNKNEYTGIFAGKNLVFIVAEGFSPIGVDQELTPTLYKLVNNGFVFDNYYQPIYNCSTSDGEFISSLSILPGVATCSMKETIGTYLPYSLGNIMKNYEYNSYAFHGWTYSYYNRDKTMPNLGYTYYGYDRYKKGYKYALKGITDSWPTSDVDVINSSYNIYNSADNFISYYMSISGHLEYNFTGGNAIANKNRDLVSKMDASNAIKAYMATQIEFDKSLEILIDNLRRDGILDDTVIVITADHYPYGLSNKEISDYVDWMKNPNFDLYKNNLVIYNSELPITKVDKYTSSLDLLPTLLNLFGINYDSRLLIGRDIFSTSEDLVIFNNKSWITSRGRYDYLKKKFEPFTDEEIEDNYIEKINEMVNLKFQMSKLLISKDYYRNVMGGK